MESLHIEFQPKIKDQLLAFLNSFSNKDLKIVESEVSFEETKKILHNRLREIDKGNVEFISIEDYEKSL